MGRVTAATRAANHALRRAAGLLVGKRAWPGTVSLRYLSLCALVAASLALLPVAASQAGLTSILLVAGPGVGPTPIITYPLVTSPQRPRRPLPGSPPALAGNRARPGPHPSVLDCGGAVAAC